jgi:hypothetical protein
LVKNVNRDPTSMRKCTIFLPALVLGVGGAMWAATPSLASPITYTETATASGSLDGTSFTNATVTLTFVGDTANITSVSGTYINDVGTATVSVSSVNGGAPVGFTDTIGVYSSPGAVLGSGTVGFADFSVGVDIFDDTSTAFAGYALGPIGPTVGTATPGDLGYAFPLAGGSFVLEGLGSSATFYGAPAPLIGRGLPVILAMGGVLLGARFLQRRQHGSCWPRANPP